MQKSIFSTSEAAELMGVKRVTINKWIRLGKLPAEKLGERSFMVRAIDLYKFEPPSPLGGRPTHAGKTKNPIKKCWHCGRHGHMRLCLDTNHYVCARRDCPGPASVEVVPPCE